MTDDEKAAVLQFMGTAYGDAHQQDQTIVGQSQQLKPISQQMKHQFEEVFNTPTQPQQQNAPAPVPTQGPAAPPGPDLGHPAAPTGPVTQISVEQATRELNTAVTPPTTQLQFDKDADSQLEFDLTAPSKLDDLINLVKKQNLLLKEISLKLDNGRAVKASKQG